jgi:branched-chain amino acid transport system substrate-binding protein
MGRQARLLCLLLTLVLVVSACGGSGDSDSGADTQSGESGGGAIDESRVDGGGDEDPSGGVELEAGSTPASMEEYETMWGENRSAVIEEISSGGYGVDGDNILRGPGGLEIDLNNCPADWSETGGIESDTITIGQTIAQSGNLAAYGSIAQGMKAYFDYVNRNGGVDGRSIELVTKDDAYVATQTIELVGEMLQSEDPFMITTLGSPNTLAVYTTLNNNCMPHPFVQTGHPAWGDPKNRPWTTGLQMSYATEAILWGNWIKENLADELPVTVGALVMDNDFGLAYGDGFQTWADSNPDVIAEFNPVQHDPAAATVTNEMAVIAAGEPDVYISMTAGNPCLLAIQEAANAGLNESAKALFTSSVCKDEAAYLIPAGDAADNWLVVGGGVKATTDPQYADEPYIAFLNEELEAAGLDPSVGFNGSGFGQYGWAFVEALRIAAELEGGLTKPNLILAIRSIDLDHPALLDGISFSVEGSTDAYLVEGSEFSRYDAANESWLQEGDVIDLDGSSPNCAWTEDGC